MKICLACSAGGHLSEILNLKSFYSKHAHYFVTFEREDSKSLGKEEKVLFIERPARNPFAFIKNFFQSWKILSREQPDLIISTGADVAFSTCLLAKLMGKKIIYIESFCRPFKPSITGRLVYHFADLFIVQWKQVWKYYPKAQYGGPIF
ncbi:MAG: PssD/Cps14F family polysaccharide biosynthesis glycosyltransferase [archaeon]|nr:PssD/Cps14F family polysaccharide biosynthesis glycosyltransferase [archaeon]